MGYKNLSSARKVVSLDVRPKKRPDAAESLFGFLHHHQHPYTSPRICSGDLILMKSPHKSEHSTSENCSMELIRRRFL
jgi:hypothetical protein